MIFVVHSFFLYGKCTYKTAIDKAETPIFARHNFYPYIIGQNIGAEVNCDENGQDGDEKLNRKKDFNVSTDDTGDFSLYLQL